MLLALTLALTGCGGTAPTGNGTDEGAGGAPATSLAPEAVGEVRVLAAASLREAFDLIKEDFQAWNPSVQVLLSYAPGAELAPRLAGGEAADVVATDAPDGVDGITVNGQPESFGGGRFTVAALNDSANATIFVGHLREGSAQRVLTDTGILRP
ncbi:substrate-binding domain-containing protein [Actinoplanes sp. DH11]|uniref:substrate-binding domain-containing protein n=1 Tax=Actinoplanes sp. DH11 TaxID=2857011 RepID=UPI001E3B647E|nr:substrate-binding domain-containing protein [Actinoplanes sp. DH11]